ncbi:hypothetical protein R2083_08235 [Nitrosomonas sp. Is35]|uniref:hypothetical protein n=1 Tax=Nitrosomonas sp. Is35 TaxID=3080534 RepID=UPI00294ABA67|nr:hypothetical protein [Nitrosomonas sp. Is35]MDV6347502.1 hypothetical protein [Nitrosomonas sp. Is35]
MENTELNDAEKALAKILNYQNEEEAFNQPGVLPEWKERKWLPYNLYQRFVKNVANDYFHSKNSTTPVSRIA